MPRVDGRLLRKPVVQLIPTADGLTVRVDDDSWPEFWCEVKIPADELFKVYVDHRHLVTPLRLHELDDDATTRPG